MVWNVSQIKAEFVEKNSALIIRMAISRSRERVNYPSRFILVPSANPYPCGYLYHPKKSCTCTQREIEKYKKRVSGPLLDRIDLYIEVPVADIKELSENQQLRNSSSSSVEIRVRVEKARQVQKNRFKKEEIYTNAEMKNAHIKKYCYLLTEIKQLLLQDGVAFQISRVPILK